MLCNIIISIFAFYKLLLFILFNIYIVLFYNKYINLAFIKFSFYISYKINIPKLFLTKFLCRNCLVYKFKYTDFYIYYISFNFNFIINLEK